MPDTVPTERLQPGATRVNDELEVGFDEIFENRFYIVGWIGRAFLVVVVATSLLGLLGRGPFSHARTPVVGGLSADYEPVARYDTPTQVTLHLAPRLTGSTVQLLISTKMIEPMGLQKVQPEPLATTSQGGDLLLTLAATANPDDHVRLQLKPGVVGPVSLTAAILGQPTLHWTQLVLP